jgi:protein-S-isoprenylcysteine O-methyltransferase Ste14
LRSLPYQKCSPNPVAYDPRMPPLAMTILTGGWCVWLAPFFLYKRNTSAPQQRDPRARWGIILQGAGFALVWQGPFWMRNVAGWRLPLSVLFFAMAAMLSWTARRTLGRQWRLDAGLNDDHELVRSGPYTIVRHPIYLSMLLMMLATGVLIGRPPALAVALAVALVGTEIRVRVEDSLLVSRFGSDFDEYRRRVPAYLPLLR